MGISTNTQNLIQQIINSRSYLPSHKAFFRVTVPGMKFLPVEHASKPIRKSISYHNQGIVPVGTFCLTVLCCSMQGPGLGNRVAVFVSSNVSQYCPNTMKVSQQGRTVLVSCVSMVKGNGSSLCCFGDFWGYVHWHSLVLIGRYLIPHIIISI